MSKPVPKRKVKDAAFIVFEELCDQFTPEFREQFRKRIWPILTKTLQWEDELTEEEFQKRLAEMRRGLVGYIRDVLRPEIPPLAWRVAKN